MLKGRICPPEEIVTYLVMRFDLLTGCWEMSDWKIHHEVIEWVGLRTDPYLYKSIIIIIIIIIIDIIILLIKK